MPSLFFEHDDPAILPYEVPYDEGQDVEALTAANEVGGWHLAKTQTVVDGAGAEGNTDGDAGEHGTPDPQSPGEPVVPEAADNGPLDLHTEE